MAELTLPYVARTAVWCATRFLGGVRMAMVMEFLERAFELKDSGWGMLIFMTSVVAFMVFSWIEHWPFRVLVVPAVFMGAAVTHAAMSDLGLHVTSDAITNQAVGFGIGTLSVLLVLSAGTWAYYEYIAH
jgi:hypothetical protein